VNVGVVLRDASGFEAAEAKPVSATNSAATTTGRTAVGEMEIRRP
jgi:hypothetical protein